MHATEPLHSYRAGTVFARPLTLAHSFVFSPGAIKPVKDPQAQKAA
jgi:hypothetical protein